MPIPTRLLDRETLHRLPDWETRLVRWLRKAAHTPFEWGQFDCALAAADALTVQTGHDFSGFWRGKYSTAKGATKRLLQQGYRDVYDAMTEALQSEAVPVDRLQNGDIGGCPSPLGRALGVIYDGQVWLPDAEGLSPHPLSSAECGWGVPLCLQ